MNPGSIANQPRTTRRSVPKAVVVTACLSAVALVAAVVGAIGPAERERASYSWPPTKLAGANPEGGWYAPLRLLNRVPERIDVTIATTHRASARRAPGRRHRGVGGAEA